MYCKSNSSSLSTVLAILAVILALMGYHHPALAQSKGGYFVGGQTGQSGKNPNSKNIWIPIPFKPVVTVATTPATGGILTTNDMVAEQLINAFRDTYGAPRCNYNLTLKQQAMDCANAYAAANPNLALLTAARPTCPGAANAGVCFGYNNAPNSNGVRSAISDPTGGWFSQYVINQLSFPPNAPATYNAAYQDFTQMIWVASTQCGCAFSATGVMLDDGVNPISQQFIYLCLMTPAGNIPATFPANVLADR